MHRPLQKQSLIGMQSTEYGDFLMDQGWKHELRKKKIEHGLLCTYHEQIQTLVRLSINGLLFEPEASQFLQAQVAPIIQQLQICLTQTYGALDILKDQDPSALLRALDNLSTLLLSDIEAALLNDPATVDPLEVIFCYPGFKAVAAYRIAHIFYLHHWPLIPRMIAELAHQETGIDIHPGAHIGSHFFIDHGTGTVIGETAILGDRVTLYQGVTLGAKSFRRDSGGAVIKGEPRHPILGNQVTVYSGATILGRISIGEGSIIGGNVWLTESVPARSRITQQQYVSQLFKDGGGI